jgi:hypothetical protein
MKNPPLDPRHPSSFRDPSGYIFLHDNEVYRRVNAVYFPQFRLLSESGLYDDLVASRSLVSHDVVEEHDDYLILRPDQIVLISYPYEWSFSQLQDAALLTLRIHLSALEHGMVLKDASAFNVQFQDGRPIFIDSLSFDEYNEGDPWLAYGQFCRHFLAPLLLMKYIAADLNRLQSTYLDGVPLDVASSMLPLRTKFIPSIATNIHLHARSYKKHIQDFASNRRPTISLNTQKNIVVSMIDFIRQLCLSSETEWGDYYSEANYDAQGFEFKEQTIKRWIVEKGLSRLWDVGANNGYFSRLIQDDCDFIICTDFDPVAVDANYQTVKKNNEEKLYPLLVDFTNPSPGIGYANDERTSFISRAHALDLDCSMALALIHHLCISANCTFGMVSDSLARAARFSIVEFVDPADSWASKLLDSKRDARDLFSFYNRENFESEFSKHFSITESVEVPNSRRTLYLMRRRS